VIGVVTVVVVLIRRRRAGRRRLEAAAEQSGLSPRVGLEVPGHRGGPVSMSAAARERA
jgi:hypothetical protein